MKQRYDKLSEKVSRATTQSYSTSFSWGIRLLHASIRGAIYSIYGFVRVADEIVDSFEGYDQQALLTNFKIDTYRAIEQKISVNPILNSFQKVVHQYKIDSDLIATFLESMETDLDKRTYSQEHYHKYIYGSAEVVGLMCLRVFTNGDDAKYDELKPYATRLGAAFQKVNFLRDMKEDYEILGRIYFPQVDIRNFNGNTKSVIENEIEADFAKALEGIRKLPDGSKQGVYLAYIYYKSLFNKIKKSTPLRILSGRVRINNGVKVGLMLNCVMLNKLKWN